MWVIKYLRIKRNLEIVGVLFLLSSLNKIGIGVNLSKIMEYGYGGTDLSGDTAKSFLNCERAEIDINYMSAIAR